MEPQFRTSFVPKSPLGSPERKVRRRAPLGIFFVAALIIFLGMLATAAGAFLYQEYVTSNIAKKSQELEQAREVFEPALVQELIRLDKRLMVSRQLLDAHVALSKFYSFLENNTLQAVQFHNFSYMEEVDELTLIMEGRAGDFAAVALQADLFRNSPILEDPNFESLNVEEDGSVSFTVSAVIDPGFVTYSVAASDVPPLSSEEEASESSEEDAGEAESAVATSSSENTDETEDVTTTP